MVEKGSHDGPATHAVTFVWNGQEVRENLFFIFIVLLKKKALIAWNEGTTSQFLFLVALLGRSDSLNEV